MGRETADHGAEGVIFFHIGTGQRRVCFFCFLLFCLAIFLSFFSSLNGTVIAGVHL